MIATKLKALIDAALKDLDFPEVSHSLEHPNELSHGDYASNVALVLGKKTGKKSYELGSEIVKYIEKHKPEEIEKVEIAGPGFLNLFLSRTFFAGSVKEVLKNGEKWGRNENLSGKKVMVEYTDPNPFKEFHIGHLMSNAVGEAVSRLVEFSGAEVKRANYQGDVGPHVARAIFGLQQLGDGQLTVEKLGEAYALGTKKYEESTKDKKAIDMLNKAIYEQNDKDVRALYEKGRALSLARFGELYKLLGTKFDHSFFESETWKRGFELVKAHPDVFEESKGATVFRGEHTRVFITSQGFPTYEAKDLGLLELKKEAGNFDESIMITASEQSDYFRVMLEAASKIPDLADIASKTKHVSHGMMRFAEGKMSSRKGNVVTGASLLGDLTTAVLEKIQGRNLSDAKKVAEQVAVGAVKYQVLKQSSGKDIVFDLEKSLSFEGDSGPYLQYTYTRAQSVLEKGEKEKVLPATEKVPGVVTDLEHLLYRFPEVALRAQEEYEPHYVATYLTELASTFNSWYASEKILDGTGEAPYKLALTKALATTMKNGLWLLGIKTPERM